MVDTAQLQTLVLKELDTSKVKRNLNNLENLNPKPVKPEGYEYPTPEILPANDFISKEMDAPCTGCSEGEPCEECAEDKALTINVNTPQAQAQAQAEAERKRKRAFIIGIGLIVAIVAVLLILKFKK